MEIFKGLELVGRDYWWRLFDGGSKELQGMGDSIRRGDRGLGQIRVEKFHCVGYQFGFGLGVDGSVASVVLEGGANVVAITSPEIP